MDKQFTEYLKSKKEQSNILRAEIRIPTNQYAYINVFFEGTPEEIKAKHDELTQVMKGEINHNDFYIYLKQLIDSDLTVWGSIDDYQLLSTEQKAIVQCLKKYTKRIIK